MGEKTHLRASKPKAPELLGAHNTLSQPERSSWHTQGSTPDINNGTSPHLNSGESSAPRNPGLGHSFGQISINPPMQAKLTVGEPNDKYEQEADRMADHVMRMPEPINGCLASSSLFTHPSVQRMCSEGDDELKKAQEIAIQPKDHIDGQSSPQRQTDQKENEEKRTLQTKPVADQITPLMQRQTHRGGERRAGTAT